MDIVTFPTCPIRAAARLCGADLAELEYMYRKTGAKPIRGHMA
ncbi:MAG TPA: hypothetical protein VK430_09900 [Xanthobacteraceae bacterium]|nr:hypothetical protein [Xanthobacteraceae bacterium]